MQQHQLIQSMTRIELATKVMVIIGCPAATEQRRFEAYQVLRINVMMKTMKMMKMTVRKAEQRRESCTRSWSKTTRIGDDAMMVTRTCTRMIWKGFVWHRLHRKSTIRRSAPPSTTLEPNLSLCSHFRHTDSHFRHHSYHPYDR